MELAAHTPLMQLALQEATGAPGTSRPVTSPSPPSPPSTTDEIGRDPWKHVGYRGYAQYLDLDDDLLVFRRFGALNTRVALSLQDQVSELEKQLANLDRAYSSRGANVNNGSLRNDMEDREELLEDITRKLVEYNTFLLQQSKLRAYAPAPRRDIRSIQNWHLNHGNMAIDMAEQDYLSHERDLICVAPRDKTPLRRLVDSSRFLRTLGVWRDWSKNNIPDNHGNKSDEDNNQFMMLPLFRRKQPKQSTQQPPKQQQDQKDLQPDLGFTEHYSDTRIDTFTSVIITIIGAIMLVIPMWILEALSGSPTATKLAVITVFVLVCLVVSSFAMVSRPLEALGASAAYAAVLMVFLQVDMD